jgi:hypothetical protein
LADALDKLEKAFRVLYLSDYPQAAEAVREGIAEIRRLRAAQAAQDVGQDEGRGEPVAWVYELARARHPETGEYTNWGPPQVTLYEPCVPEGSIRNLRPLYAMPSECGAE